MKHLILIAVLISAIAALAPATAQAQTCYGQPNASTWISCNLACETIAEVCCPGECRDTVAEWNPYFDGSGGICTCSVWCDFEAESCSGGGGGGGAGGGSGDVCDDTQDCIDAFGPGWYCVLPQADYSWCELEFFPQ